MFFTACSCFFLSRLSVSREHWLDSHYCLYAHPLYNRSMIKHYFKAEYFYYSYYSCSLNWTISISEHKTCGNWSNQKVTYMPRSVLAGHKSVCASVNQTYICRRSSGTSSLILMKVVFVAGLFGLTGRNRSSVTISFNVASHAAYSIT